MVFCFTVKTVIIETGFLKHCKQNVYGLPDVLVKLIPLKVVLNYYLRNTIKS